MKHVKAIFLNPTVPKIPNPFAWHSEGVPFFILYSQLVWVLVKYALI